MGLGRTIARIALAWGVLAGASPARSETEVDLALVLAVDISYSMDMDELTLQRQGFAEAFRSPLVQDAIKRGMLGKISVVYLEWAGSLDQRVMVPWSIIDGPQTANAFADRVAAVPVRRAQRTSISGAIDFSLKTLGESGVEATRRVIDVSGDGPNNQGRLVTPARDEAVAQGITINGLPLQLKQPGYLDIPDLDIYYKDCVIGGQGAFMIPVRDKAQFQNAIKTKVLLEVAGLTPPEPLIHPAQDGARANCLIGELMWRERMGN